MPVDDLSLDGTLLLHPLCDTATLPPRLNNPFYYEPDALSRAAIAQFADWLYGRSAAFAPHPVPAAFRADIDRGKMMGVLVVCDDTHGRHPAHPGIDGDGVRHLSFLAAYSGQICGRSDWPGFVPAVFDYLQPDGYFKTHEAEITSLNHEASRLGQALGKGEKHSEHSDYSDYSPRPAIHKARLEGETDEQYVRRRQFENAELHRWKLRQRERQVRAERLRRAAESRLTALRTLRRQKSDNLQRWLFHHFVMRNGRGEAMDLIGITQWAKNGDTAASDTTAGDATASDATAGGSSTTLLPPAGSGECCEPKLLQYALSHGLRPVSMAMFWWGESPRGEVRHHLQCYPACNGKCKPILRWMLQGIDVAPNPLDDTARDAALAARLRTLYDDEAITVVSKPAGLLAVPGKNGRESVLAIMRRRFPKADSPLIVHRLDMDTSGLMVIAKTTEAYHDLQRQFAAHTVKKRYVAIVMGQPPHDEGTISLPLRPQLDDRPRQVVDEAHGRPAVTSYRVVARLADGRCRLWLSPHTGRTHQLRVHCAHRSGLGCPIQGDALYGSRDSRLFLHAEEITFRHPVTGRTMTLTDKAPF